MTILDRIGIDLGTPSPADAPAMSRAAADAGARIARVRFALGPRSSVDDLMIEDAVAVADALVAAGLKVLGVIDGGLTVAPDGLGEGVPDALSEAWADELAENAAALVGALGTRVAAWEVLPAPNAPDGPRLTAARWATAVDRTCRAIDRAAPEARRIAGGLWSDDLDDGVDYLRTASRAVGWPTSGPPFDGLGIQLRLFRDGGPSEGTVAAMLGERSQRLWRAAAAALGDNAVGSLWVTGVAWDAVYAGESAQARNAWTALDTFTANPDVAAVFWSGLVDEAGATGLYASGDLSPDRRRPAWRAFKDFALYAAQISPAPQILIEELGEAFVVDPGSGSGAEAAPEAPWPEAPKSQAPSEPFGRAGAAGEPESELEGSPAWAWDDAPDEADEADEVEVADAADMTGDVIDLEPTRVDGRGAVSVEAVAPAEGFAAGEALPVDANDDALEANETNVASELAADDDATPEGELTEEVEVDDTIELGAVDPSPWTIDRGVVDLDGEGGGGAIEVVETADEGVAPDRIEFLAEDEAFGAPDHGAGAVGAMGMVGEEAGAADKTVPSEAPAAADEARDDDWLGRPAGDAFDIEPTIVGASDRAPESAPQPAEGDNVTDVDAQGAAVAEGDAAPGTTMPQGDSAPGIAAPDAAVAEDDEDAPVLWTIPPSPLEPQAPEAAGAQPGTAGVPGGETRKAEAASPTEPAVASVPPWPATAPAHAVEQPAAAEPGGAGAATPIAPDSVTVRIPTLADILRGQGLDGQRLDAALRALESRAGGPGHWPPPGDYAIAVAPPVASTAPHGPVGGGPTNQAVLSALYRAGGGRWTLIERAGLDLTRLVTERSAAYEGPDVADLPGLSDAEREAVRAAMG